MKEKWQQGLKIYSISANNLYEHIERKGTLYKNKIVMPPSLLLKYMTENLEIGKYDVIQVKFDYDFYADDEIVEKEVLREKYYSEGFSIDWEKETVTYKVFFRTVSKSKKGEVFYINVNLYNAVNEWQTMGLCDKIEKYSPCKLVELEAYKSLTASGIEGIVKIKPSEILILKDLKSSHKREVDVVRTDKDKKCYVSVVKKDVTNILFDGQALADNSLFDSDSDNGMMVLRNHFFKACAFRTNIQAFMRDWCNENGKNYETYQVRDMFGSKKYVKNIKMITTDNAIKWVKFQELFIDIVEAKKYWEDKIRDDGCLFGIVKTDHPSKYGKYQRLSYQMINSMPLSKDEVKELVQYEIDKVSKLKEDKDFFVSFLEENSKDDSEDIKGYKMLADLITKKGMIDCDYVNSRRIKIISGYVKDLKRGKIEVTGDNLTVVQNPIEMLYYAVGNINVENPTAKEFEIRQEYVEVSTEHFDYGVKLGAFRNPHNAPNNIIAYKNVKCPLIEKYCRFGKNIIAINGIKTDTEDRCNSMDFDADFQLVTDNEIIVQKALDCYCNYLTIVNEISEEDSNQYVYSDKDKSKIDIKLAKSQMRIGSSSNYAQVAQSLYWDELSKENPDMEKAKTLKEYFIILSVLAQVQIDSAKRTYAIGEREIERIVKAINAMDSENANVVEYEYSNSKGELKKEKKYFIYPEFFQHIYEDCVVMGEITDEEKKNKPKKGTKYIRKNIKCPMNYLVDIIEKNIPRASFTETRSYKDYYSDNADMECDKTVNWKQICTIKLMSEKYIKAIIQQMNGGKDVDGLTLYSHCREATERAKRMKINNATMKKIIQMAMESENGKFRTTILKILYKYHKEQFLGLFADEIPKMQENEQESIAKIF